MKSIEEREFWLGMNSLSAILGSLNEWSKTAIMPIRLLIQCVHHLRKQNIILYDEVVRLSDEISKMKEKENGTC